MEESDLGQVPDFFGKVIREEIAELHVHLSKSDDSLTHQEQSRLGPHYSRALTVNKWQHRRLRKRSLTVKTLPIIFWKASEYEVQASLSQKR